MKIYRTKTVWKIITVLLAPPLVCFFFYIFYSAITSATINWTYLIVSFLLAFGLNIFFIYGTFEAFKSKIIIGNKEFIKINVLGKKQLKFNEIKGYSEDNNYLYLSPKSSNHDVIKISQYFQNKNEWKSVIYRNFKNLEIEALIKETKSFKKDKTYGKTQKKRDQNITNTKKWTWIINGTSVVLGIWFLISPSKYYQELSFFNLLLPFLALILLRLFNGRIKAVTDNESPYPSVTTTLIFTPLVILLRVLLDYDILSYSNAWLYTFIIAPLITFLFVKIIKNELIDNSKNALLFIVYPFFAIITSAFIFFSSVLINCTYDTNYAQKFKSRVLNKRITSGKHTTTYLMTVENSSELSNEIEIEASVTSQTYNRYNEGDPISLNIQEGLLSIPWYYIE